MRSGLKVIEERTDNKLAGNPAHRELSACRGFKARHNETLTVRIMSKAFSHVNAFLRIMRILLIFSCLGPEAAFGRIQRTRGFIFYN